MEQRRPTIYDIAKFAGVSHMTVSRYLTFNGARTRAVPRERIRRAIAELDYRPNLAARALRTNRTGRLAIVFPAGNAISSIHMLTGATEAATDAGYHIDAITLAGSSDERSARVLELAEAGLFEGLLALTPLAADRQAQIASRVPVVVGAEYDDEMRGIGDLADASPVGEIIETLAGLGHRSFLHIAGDRAYTTVRSREQAFLETVHRLDLESGGVVGGDWNGESGRRAILDLPDNTPVTAVIAANDVLAAAAIYAALERGWRVPEDLSVSGWDNSPVGEWLPPTLTSVKIDYEELGRRSMAKLLANMRGEAEPTYSNPVASVVWRKSTGPAPLRADEEPQELTRPAQ
ncbi:LacI family DNA-binding transcriptional regulator [Paenarthrobacter sp. CM16]|uniref:LacI family DNA-binding transcriptional regulator n=1 Tax=Paenarthrobacter sp. CM16 TaxID=2738447 RepID=UPI00155504DD|nr:LacI family DNA-binding transcriptional regulator [Paenarthrobacter sp. CM16]NQD89524.1 LacI family DNA-binding transcriptional regulator [Paenarthrobacter sp. CM16]